MYFKDKSKYSYDLPFKIDEVQNVGWLEKGIDFDTGETSLKFAEKILQIIGREEVNIMRGAHYCDLCNGDEKEQRLKFNNKNIFLGMAEIWIPSGDGSIIFAAPTLIYHYITVHKYKPPEEFINSVNNFPIASDWNGQKEYEKLINKYFKDFNKR
ncbi:MAG: hypothetical protein M3033_14805 [Acidobacteriota bacterium]|nr:hypothetical protein [Acidobacteriota bacterium]